MTNLRARAFAPALFVLLFIALTVPQHAFSQETQTAAPPAQPIVAATTDKVASRDEACEQSPAQTAAAPASIEQIVAGKSPVAASQPLNLPPAPTVANGAARPLSFATDAQFAARSFNASGLSTPAQDSPGGAPQTSASPYTPLTSGEKMRRGFKNAFLSPQAYALPLVSAIITEWGEDDLPHKDTDDRVADGLSRFAIKFGRRATNNLLGGVYSSAFRQDPRYERAAEGTGAGARIVHAATRVFVTRGDNGKHQPNYTRFASQLSSSALSNLWEQTTPGHDRIGTDATFRRFGNSFITGVLFNVVNEFLPDIKKIFGR
ncbi:MAG TPA: hypothetical protein VF703_02405 [Pyrinomonadaceae bacterium]|jgi:hypothetical protein